MEEESIFDWAARRVEKDRQRLIRLVVARDWAVAIRFAIADDDVETYEKYIRKSQWSKGWDDGWESAGNAISSLPCAADFVDAMLGGEK